MQCFIVKDFTNDKLVDLVTYQQMQITFQNPYNDGVNLLRKEH